MSDYLKVRQNIDTVNNIIKSWKNTSESIMQQKDNLIDWCDTAKKSINKKRDQLDYQADKENNEKTNKLKEKIAEIERINNDFKEFETRKSFLLNSKHINNSELTKNNNKKSQENIKLSPIESYIKLINDHSVSIKQPTKVIQNTQPKQVFGGCGWSAGLLVVGWLLALFVGALSGWSSSPILIPFVLIILLSPPIIGYFYKVFKYPDEYFKSVRDFFREYYPLEELLSYKSEIIHNTEIKIKQDLQRQKSNNLSQYEQELKNIEQSFLTKKEEINNKLNLLSTSIVKDTNKILETEKKISEYGLSTVSFSKANSWKKWEYDDKVVFHDFLRFGSMRLNPLKKGLLPDSKAYLEIPLIIPMDNGINLITVTKKLADDSIRENLKSFYHELLLRYMAMNRAGDVVLYLLDPYGSGSSFDFFSKVKDINNKLINKKICTNDKDIKEALQDINNEMATIIQDFLQDKYKTVYQYNKIVKNDDNISTVPIPNRVLIIFGFPKYFNSESIALIKDIMQKGSQCGISVFMVVDENELPEIGYKGEQLVHNLTKNLVNQTFIFEIGNDTNNLFKINKEPPQMNLAETISLPVLLENDPILSKIYKANIKLDKLPDNEDERNLMNDILVKICEKSVNAMKLEIPFEELLKVSENRYPPFWQGKASDLLECPLGIKGGKDLHFIRIGEEDKQHGIIIGKTGSGKTNLFHVMINALSLLYHPDELDLYLIDFKKGVGFKPYADKELPHCKAIAIESDREYGLNILEYLTEEINKRSKEFKKLQVDKYSKYREVIANRGDYTNPVFPRILLIIDEFQVLFTYSDNIAKESLKLMENIARQGRAFGIHFLLGSQTLKGVSSDYLSSGIFSQISIRILLMCNKSDSDLIFGIDNDVSRLIKRAGQAYYNDENGARDANTEFQISLISTDVEKDHKSDLLNSFKRVEDLKKQHSYVKKELVVFDGSKDFEIDSNRDFRQLIEQHEWLQMGQSPKIILGLPTGIENSLKFSFYNRTKNHLLIISLQSHEGISIMFNSLICLAIQHRPHDAIFYMYNLLNMEQVAEENDRVNEDYFQQFEEAFSTHDYHKITDQVDFEDSISALYDEYQSRETNRIKNPPKIYYCILGIQFIRNLDLNNIRISNSPILSLSQKFQELIIHGSDQGIHFIIHSNNLSGLQRVFDSTTLKEFGRKILSLMSDSDSRKLIGTEDASSLDEGRYIFTRDEKADKPEKFRGFINPGTKLINKFGAFIKKQIKTTEEEA